ncbi:hypothetical protein O181_040977 [Austropuccinia psidii MF-1]|uniref:Uncharacterized protein n=1 Tax=Austropuccinia psidii MF-1 TaxID=1389203 RepID=A0A9Q3DFV4_9BASI|nr:hypothetical protein [Austropuccinia psidii MF-1]
MNYKLALVFLPAFFQLCTAAEFTCRNQPPQYSNPVCLTNHGTHVKSAEPANNGPLFVCPEKTGRCCSWKPEGEEPVPLVKVQKNMVVAPELSLSTPNEDHHPTLLDAETTLNMGLCITISQFLLRFISFYLLSHYIYF